MVHGSLGLPGWRLFRGFTLLSPFSHSSPSLIGLLASVDIKQQSPSLDYLTIYIQPDNRQKCYIFHPVIPKHCVQIQFKRDKLSNRKNICLMHCYDTQHHNILESTCIFIPQFTGTGIRRLLVETRQFSFRPCWVFLMLFMLQLLHVSKLRTASMTAPKAFPCIKRSLLSVMNGTVLMSSEVSQANTS